jgi:transforming growth factor-beta-induced protein
MTTQAIPITQLDVLETAVSSGSFETLAAALEAADLADALKGAGPFTVFAPTDEAFAKLPRGLVKILLQPDSKGKLTAILTYHVLPARVTAEEIVHLSSAKTLNGEPLQITANQGHVQVNQSRLISADILCSNGIIHVIDSVLIPE